MTKMQQDILCQMCPNTEFFLVRIWTLFMQYIKMSSTSQLEQMSDEKSTVEEKEKSRLC